jgi:hypothetical protein
VVVAAVEADIVAAATVTATKAAAPAAAIAERLILLELLMVCPSRSGRTRLAGRWPYEE